MVVKQLQDSEPILKEFVHSKKLIIVGARYDLDDGGTNRYFRVDSFINRKDQHETESKNILYGLPLCFIARLTSQLKQTNRTTNRSLCIEVRSLN